MSRALEFRDIEEKRQIYEVLLCLVAVLINIRLKADPSLQLGDVITVNINQLQVSNNKSNKCCYLGAFIRIFYLLGRSSV